MQSVSLKIIASNLHCYAQHLSRLAFSFMFHLADSAPNIVLSGVWDAFILNMNLFLSYIHCSTNLQSSRIVAIPSLGREI
jgi:hypothetical protein